MIAASLSFEPARAEDAVVRYALSYDDGRPGVVDVELRLDGESLPQVLVMPRAIPMGYGEQPYDRFVSDVSAVAAGGAALPVSREDGPRWRIEGPGRLASVRYRVDVAKLEREVLSASDASKARDGYVGLLGYSVLAFLEGLEQRGCHLTVDAPDDWPAFSTLAPRAPPARGRVVATAGDFYALADSQIALGPRLQVLADAGAPPLFVAAYAEDELDVARVLSVGREALDALVAYFGSAPFPHYTLVVEVLRPMSAEHRYGFSMEHLDSGTFFLDARGALTRESSARQVRRTRYNYAHHVAHSWIPKRSSGEGYFPFSWELAPVIDTIWLSEGFAQYAAAAALAARMGDGGDAYLEAVIDLRFRSTLAKAPAFIRRMDAVELSRVASTRYSEDFRTGAGSFSRGGMMAAELDAHIRGATDGARSFRDVVRYLVAWRARERRPFRLDEIPELIERGAGVEVRAIYDKWMAAPDAR